MTDIRNVKPALGKCDCFRVLCSILCSLIFTFTSPLPTRVLGAPQTTSQPVSSIFLCSPLPSGTWQTPGLSIPWCCLPTSSSVCLVFFPLSLCLAGQFWPDLMNGRPCPYHFSLHLFMMVSSSCGLITCWILAQTSLLVTLVTPLYE